MITTTAITDLSEIYARPMTQQEMKLFNKRQRTLRELKMYEAGKASSLKIKTELDNITKGFVSPVTPETLDEFLASNGNMSLNDAKIRTAQLRTTFSPKSNSKDRKHTRRYKRATAVIQSGHVNKKLVPSAFVMWLQSVTQHGVALAHYPFELFPSEYKIRGLQDTFEFLVPILHDYHDKLLLDYGLTLLSLGDLPSDVPPALLSFYNSLMEITVPATAVPQSGIFEELNKFFGGPEGEKADAVIASIRQIVDLLKDHEVKDTIYDLKDSVKEIKSTTSMIKQVVDSNPQLLPSITAASMAFSQHYPMVAKVSAFWGSYGQYVPLVLTALAYCMHHVYSGEYRKIFITLGFAILGLIVVMFPSEIIGSFYDFFNYFRNWWKAPSQVQSGVSDMFVGAMSAFVLSGSKLEQLPNHILSKLTGFDKASATFERLYDGVTEFILDSFEYVGQKIGMPFERDRSILETRIRDAGLFIAKFSSSKYRTTMLDFEECESYLRRVNEDIATYNSGKPALLTLLRQHKESLQKIQSKLAPMYGSTRLSRVEPVFALVIGAPGIGKSLTSERIASEVTLNCLPECDKEDFKTNPNSFIHNRIPNKYWEGYSESSFTTRFDDLGQMNEVPGQQDPELMDHVIRAVNTFPYPLNMAFDGKGKTMFNSKFIIATSNLCDIVNETVKDKGAVDRRIKFRLVAYPRDEYCADTSKAEWLREFKPDVRNDNWVKNIDDYLYFKIVSLQPGSREPYATGEPMTIQRVIDMISKAVKNKIRIHNERYVQITQTTGSAYAKAFPLHRTVHRHELDKDDEVCDSLRSTYMSYYKASEVVPYVTWLKAIEKKHPHFMEALKADPDPASLKNYLIYQDQEDVLFFIDFEDISPPPEFDPNVLLPETWWQKAYRKTKEASQNKAVRIAVALASLTLAGYTAKKTYNYFTSSSPVTAAHSPLAEQQSRDYTTKGLKYKPKESNNLKEAMVQAGAYYDPARNSIMSKVANRNLAHISVIFNDTAETVHELGFGFYIKDDLMLLPNHFLYNMNKHLTTSPDLEMQVELQFGVNTFQKVYVRLEDFVTNAVAVDADDLSLVRVPRCGLGPRPNVLKYVATKEDHEKNLKKNGVLTKVRTESTALIENYTHFMDMEQKLISGDVPELFAYIGNVPVQYNRVYKYPVPTEVGDCGMLLSIPNTRNATAKIFGMHVLGCATGAYGYATKLCKEDILEAVARLEESTETITDIISEEDPLAVTQCGAVPEVKHISHINTLPHKIAAATASKMEPSPFFELFQPATTKPAILRPFENSNGSFNPYTLGLQKYCINAGFLDPAEVELVCRYMFENLRRNSTSLPLSKGILTIEQACEGIPDMGIGGIPKRTSPGYPYVLKNVPGLPYRYRFFGKEPGYNFDNEHFVELKETINEAIDKAKHGIRTPWYIVDNLKDEDLPVEKVDNGKARIFCAVPLPKLILDKMYFGAFAAWITDNKVFNGISIGVNVYGLDWHDAAVHLKCFPGSQYGAGDFSGFDGSQRGIIHQHICDQINKWYDDGPENARIRRVLFADVYNSYHIRGDKVFEWVGGMTSGFYLTAHLNSLYNLFAFTRVYAQIFDYDPQEMTLMNKRMRVLVMGDDNVYGVSPELSEHFTEAALAKSFGEIGLKYTNELKTGEINDSLREFEALEFCKRKFRYSESLGAFVAPMRLDALFAALDYFKKDREFLDIQLQLTNIIGEFALHGKDTFEKYAPKLIEAAAFKGYTVEWTDFDIAFHHITGASLVW